MNERGGHIDELGAQLDVQCQCALHVVQILLCDGGDGDVVNVDFLFTDQVEQEIERPVVLLQMKIQRR